MTRAEIVDEALSYLGAPFRHQGRTMEGIDCVGLVIVVARALGAVPPGFDVTGYPRRPDGSMTGILRDRLVRIPRAAAGAGSVVQIAAGIVPFHVGIMIDARRFVHAYALRDRVCIDILDENWRLANARVVTAFDFPGVGDGARC